MLYFFLNFNFSISNLSAQDNEYDSAGLFDDFESVSIATGYSIPIHVTPAVASVITADDLLATGVTTINEALEQIPGVYNLFKYGSNHYVFRGIRTKGNTNPDILIMIDGIPQNDFHIANQRKNLAKIPLYNIDRIEVIRGPVSAVLGSDAFAGVINIITKQLTGIKKSVSSFRAGSYNTKEFRHTSKLLDDNLIVGIQLTETDGHAPYIEKDTQTAFDGIFGTNASNAPGNAATNNKEYSFIADYFIDHWRLRLRARGHETGLGGGIIGALDPEGKIIGKQYNLEAKYKKVLARDWDTQIDINYFDFDVTTKKLHALPRGFSNGLFTFPNGVIDNPSYSERHFRTEVSTIYKGNSSHISRVGAGIEYAEVYNVRQSRNYISDPNTGSPDTPTDDIYNLSQNELYSRNESRNIKFLYLQDEWNFDLDWILTAGLRYDSYSDVGDVVNPRFALVWSTTANLTTKFLAGRGYRAPTFIEFYAGNNPSSKGNQNLKPVRITNYEVAFDYIYNNLKWQGSIFYHDIEDSIEQVPITLTATQSQNTKGNTGRGFELSGNDEINKFLNIDASYSYQKNTSKDNGNEYSQAPQNIYYTRIDWKINRENRINAVLHYYQNFNRENGDSRAQVPDYNDLKLTYLFIPNINWTISMSVKNALDDAALSGSEPNANDQFLPGRNYYLELIYLL